MRIDSAQRYHAPAKACTDRRTTEGNHPGETRRCLERHIARDLHRLLDHGPTPN